MSTNLNLTLDIAKSTLLNTQILMGTASHNIANADNTSYARQTAVVTTKSPIKTSVGFLGTGARVEDIVQQRDEYIEKALLGATSSQADYETRLSLLETAGAYLLDTGDEGISSLLGDFWDSWNALNNDPSQAQETLVQESTENLVSALQEAATNLSDMAGDVEESAQDEVDTINSLLSKIADFNYQIVRNEGSGVSANDLRDLRYEALTELAESLPISYTEEDNGSLTITVEDYSGEMTLVSGNDAGSLTYDTANHRVTYADTSGTTYPTAATDDNSLSSGRLNAYMTVYDSVGTSHTLTYVLANPDAGDLTYVDRLNAFAANLITEVNAVHEANGGSAVFDDTVLVDTFNAADIQIDSSFVIDSGQALSMAELQDQDITDLGGSKFSEYLSNIQEVVGSDQEDAEDSLTFQEALVSELQTQQQSVSGVSIEEEMVDLLKFQQVYQAAAKVIQQTAEMMDTVINMV